MKKICFDAGHYKDYNPSKVYPKYREGTRMWDLHLLVKGYLEENYKVEIILTRSEIEKDKRLHDRGYLSKGCLGFYSFHSNATDDTNVDRVVIIPGCNSKGVNDFAQELGVAIKKAIGIKGDTQIYRREHNNQDYYGVLRSSAQVGVNNRFIIEHGFHTNKHVAMWLNDVNNLKKLAKIEGDIIAKFHKLERKNKPTPKMIKVIKDVNYRWKNDFSKDEYIKGVAKKGEVFTVVERVKSNTITDMYRLKSGYYITTSSKYIEVYK